MCWVTWTIHFNLSAGFSLATDGTRCMMATVWYKLNTMSTKTIWPSKINQFEHRNEIRSAYKKVYIFIHDKINFLQIFLDSQIVFVSVVFSLYQTVAIAHLVCLRRVWNLLIKCLRIEQLHKLISISYTWIIYLRSLYVQMWLSGDRT